LFHNKAINLFNSQNRGKGKDRLRQESEKNSRDDVPYALVVCEKPDAAKRIAQALGGGSRTAISKAWVGMIPVPVPVFESSYRGRRFVICSAIGHMYGLVDITKSKSVYPVFDLEWRPLSDSAGRTATRVKMLQVISSLAKNAEQFIHACDYDQEGEVIGYNILQYACGGQYGRSMRARFSTLTDEEIRKSFDDLLKPGTKMAEAGRSRHMLDFFYGINLSRALSQSFKKSNDNKRYRNLSIGRVQGPTLAFVTDREVNIRNHIPDPYWTVEAEFEKGSGEGEGEKRKERIVAHYQKNKIPMLSEANRIVEICSGKSGAVTELTERQAALRPPTPFNLGDLQREAYRLFKISPAYTLSIAEKLYLAALISYPRTSSQKLPASIGYEKIISKLSGTGSYKHLTSALLAKSRLVPNEGAKSDPAHPAIYPTGVAPRRRLDALEYKVYDLVVKRFLATFGDSAVTRRTVALISIDIDVDANGKDGGGSSGQESELVFVAEGRALLYEGWIFLYRPYFRFEEVLLPELRQGETLKCVDVAAQEKFTQPPPRFNQASLLEKMESENIGTKATRAIIINTLFKRNYIVAERAGIEATDLGFAVIESMNAFVPNILSSRFTRAMEEELEAIEYGTGDSVLVIERAVDRLIESLAVFKENEKSIGQLVTEATATDSVSTEKKSLIIGTCPVCQTGKLRVIRSTKTKKRFVGCSNYSSNKADGCKATAPLPQRGTVIPTKKSCEICGWPIANIVFARRSGGWKICINMQCPSKQQKGKERAETRGLSTS